MSQQQPFSIASGPLPVKLGNDVSDAINAALRRGMETDEACSIALQVVTDYWRGTYDDAQPLAVLLATLIARPILGKDEGKPQ